MEPLRKYFCCYALYKITVGIKVTTSSTHRWFSWLKRSKAKCHPQIWHEYWWPRVQYWTRFPSSLGICQHAQGNQTDELTGINSDKHHLPLHFIRWLLKPSTLEMFFLNTEYFLRNTVPDEKEIPLPPRPVALTGVNYTLDQREASARFGLGGGGTLPFSRQRIGSCWRDWLPDREAAITGVSHHGGSPESLEGSFRQKPPDSSAFLLCICCFPFSFHSQVPWIVSPHHPGLAILTIFS